MHEKYGGDVSCMIVVARISASEGVGRQFGGAVRCPPPVLYVGVASLIYEEIYCFWGFYNFISHGMIHWCLVVGSFVKKRKGCQL